MSLQVCDFAIELHRRACIVCSLFVLVSSFWVAIPLASALPILGHHGRWLTDPQGRVVILHGVQIDKFEPTVPIEYVDLGPANVAFMAAEGFNLARVSLAYAGYEPTLGGFDQAYLDSYLAFDRRLAKSGVYDLLDMMQGQYSAVLNGWGFPDWMTVTAGLPDGKQPFPQGYFVNPAENRAWDNLYADAHASDGVGLQEHYAAGLRRIAGQFAAAPGLLGVEILNEPWPGSRAASCIAPAGCPPGGFDQTSLTGFSRRMVRAVRAADPHHLIAYEPNLLFDYGDATGLGTISDPNLLLAFHNYCLAYITTPGNEPSTRCTPEEQSTLANAGVYQQQAGVGLLMDEWGNTVDTKTISRVAAEADQHMVGWSYWALEDCCNSAAAIMQDGTKSPTTPGNLRMPILEALVRPYPKLLAGRPLSWSYDPTSAAFTLTYSTRPAAGGTFAPGTDTEIELPALHYPTGYTVAVTGARVRSAPDANLLQVENQPQASTVRVTVTPAHHHPSAPGPFAWPATLTNIAPADCSAAARTTIRIRYRRRNAHIVRAVIYIDGQRVAVKPGHRLRRIVLPAGLADGTVVRLVAITTHGARFTTTRNLRGCSLQRRTWTI